MSGFIYILSNPAYREGLIKIGISAQDPEGQRASELRSTGVPSPFQVEYYAFIDNYSSVEKKIHNIFRSSRWESDREFFNCSIPEAILAIRQNSQIKFEKINYKSPEAIIAKEAELEKKKAVEKANLEKIKEQKASEKRKADEFLELEKVKKRKHEAMLEAEDDVFIRRILGVLAVLLAIAFLPLFFL